MMFRYFGIVAGFALVVVATPSIADEKQQQTSIFDGMYTCSSLTNDSERLACFDLAVHKIKTAEAAGSIVAVDREQMQNLRREAFGFELPSLPKLRIPTLLRLGSDSGKSRSSDLSTASDSGGQVIRQAQNGAVMRVTFPLARTSQKSNGKTVFYLKNGQVWTQSRVERVRIPRTPGELSVEIRRAALGSYLLKVNGEGRAIRVRRTK